ncbi:MAG: zinc metalloprotease [Planctomycetota bacterium]|jgi:hypothetical protein
MQTYQHKTRTATTVMAILIATATLGSRARADTFNIEIDYMVKTGADAHSHQPTTDEVNAVIQMFACQGHTLNIVVDDALPHYNAIPREPPDCGTVFGYSGEPGSWGQLKADYFDHAGQGGWHYCIFAHRYEYLNDDGDCVPSGSSGLAELGGDDLIVSLGGWTDDIGTPWDRAGTLAHEFGHNLGLHHCGDMSCGSVGPRPLNVASVMSYYYQLSGVRANLECQGLTHVGASLFKNLDFSHGTMCTLYEGALWEFFGTGMMSVDWNCNGTIAGTPAQDLNGWAPNSCGADTGLQILSDYNEWANIYDTTRDRDAQLDNLPESSCITLEEIDAYRADRAWCPQPAAVPEACEGSFMYYVSTNGDPSNSGDCSSPRRNLMDAYGTAPYGSVIYLAPGTYDEVTPLTLDKRMTIAGPGGAQIR